MHSLWSMTFSAFLLSLQILFPCFIVFLFVLYFWYVTRTVVDTARTMHSVPCAKCQFFTNSYCLKCTVHPYIALTEAAIDCRDYIPVSE
jgi:hypothetical protein